MKGHNYRVYIMASRSRVIYIGMTNNLGKADRNDQTADPPTRQIGFAAQFARSG